MGGVFGGSVRVEEGGGGCCCGCSAGVGWSGEDGGAVGGGGGEQGEVDGVAVVFGEGVGVHLEDVD